MIMSIMVMVLIEVVAVTVTMAKTLRSGGGGDLRGEKEDRGGRKSRNLGEKELFIVVPFDRYITHPYIMAKRTVFLTKYGKVIQNVFRRC